MDKQPTLKKYRRPPQPNAGNNHPQTLNSTQIQDGTRLPVQTPSVFPTAKQPEANRTYNPGGRVTSTAAHDNVGNRVSTGEQKPTGSNNQRAQGQVVKSKKIIASSSKKYLNLNRTPKRMNPPSPVKKFLPSGSGSAAPQEHQRTKERLAVSRTPLVGYTARPFFAPPEQQEPRPMLATSIPSPSVVPTPTPPEPSLAGSEHSPLSFLTRPINLGLNDNLVSRQNMDSGVAGTPTRILISGGKRQIPDSTSTLGFVYRDITDDESRIYGKNYDGPPKSEGPTLVSKWNVNRLTNAIVSGPSNPRAVEGTKPVTTYAIPHPSTTSGPQAEIVPQASPVTVVQNNFPFRISDVPHPIPDRAAALHGLVPHPVGTSATHTNPHLTTLHGFLEQGRQLDSTIPPSPTEVRRPELANSDTITQKSTKPPLPTQAQQPSNFVNSQSTPQKSAIPAPSPQPLSQVQTNTPTLQEDRIAERVFSLLQPAVLSVAEIGKIQKGMVEMIQDMKSRLDTAEKERRASEENAKKSATDSSSTQMDVDENVTQGSNTQVPGEDKDTTATKATEDIIKSVLVLADRVHAVVKDLGAVKRAIGVNDSGGGSHGAVGHENPVGEHAMRGRKRRKLASLGENKDTSEEELMLVDGEWKPLSSNLQPKTYIQSRSIHDRLDGIEMDLQECLERARDPLAAAVVEDKTEKEMDSEGERDEKNTASVVRHEMGTSPIKFPAPAPLSVRRTLQPALRLNPTQDRRQKDLISLGSSSANSKQDPAPIRQFATRRPNGSTTARVKPLVSLSSLTSSSTSIVDHGDENKQKENQKTKVEVQESGAMEDDDFARLDAEVVGANANQEQDVFGPLMSNPSPFVGSISCTSSATKNHHLPKLTNGDDRADDENNASTSGTIGGDVDMIMGDGESEHPPLLEGSSRAPSTQTAPKSGSDPNLNVSTTRASTSTHRSRLKAQRSGSNKSPSGFSPVDWSKAQTSAGRSIPSAASQVLQITPKLKLKLNLSPSHQDPTKTAPPPPSAPVPLPTDSASYMPTRSYTMPPLPEGSVAALRQQALGTPYLSFDAEPRHGSRREGGSSNEEHRRPEEPVEMVMGADAAERMLSPESQISKEDDEEDDSEEENDQEEEGVESESSEGQESEEPNVGYTEGDESNVATAEESSLPADNTQSTGHTSMNQDSAIEERDISVPEIEMDSAPPSPSNSARSSDNISSPIPMNAKIGPPSKKANRVKELSNSQIQSQVSQTTEDETVVNSLIIPMSQSSDTQDQARLPQSPIVSLANQDEVVTPSRSPSPTPKQKEAGLFSQDDGSPSPKSPQFSSPRPTTASPPPHSDLSHHEDDPEEETEGDIVKAKEELNSPYQVPKANLRGTEGDSEREYLEIPSDPQSLPPQVKRPRPKPKPKQKAVIEPEIIVIDELPTPKKAAPKQKKKKSVERESSIISISSGSEDEVVITKASTSSSRLTSTGTSNSKAKPRPRPLTRGSLVKLEVFTQPVSLKSRGASEASALLQPVASSSRNTKEIEEIDPVADDAILGDGESKSELEIQMPHAPSTPPPEPPRISRSMSKSGKKRQNISLSRSRSPSKPIASGSKLGRLVSKSNAERKSRSPSSPLSDLPSSSGSESESDDEDPALKSSFDVAKYTAKLVDDDAEVVRVKPKSVASSVGRNTEAEAETGERSKSGLQALIANKKKAKENSKALTKIKKRKRVASGASSLGNGLEDEEDEQAVDEWDKPPLKRVKMRPEAQKDKELPTSVKGKGKEKPKDKTTMPPGRRVGQDDQSENASTASSQSRYPLRLPQKTASTSKLATHSAKAPAKTPKKSRESNVLDTVEWPTVLKPDFSQHIECDTCGGWYHIGCVGVESHDIRLQPSEIYKCPVCEAGIDRKNSPVKNVTEKDFKAKSDCARPDCLRETMKSKSKKTSPSTLTTSRGRSRSRKVKVEIEEEEPVSPGDDGYIVENFIGRWKRYVGGEGLVFQYLVKWHGYGFGDATWQSIESLEMANPDIVVEAFEKAAKKENYDLQNGDEEVVLLHNAAEAGWTLERTFEPRSKK